MSQSSVMPGFRPTIGFTLIYLGLVVLTGYGYLS